MKVFLVRRRTIGLLVALVIVFFAYGAAALSAGLAKECSPVAVGQISESADFTPYAFQRGGQLGDHRINPNGITFVRSSQDAGLPASIDGLGVTFVTRASTGLYGYYLDATIDLNTTDEGFLAAGGIEYSVESAGGNSSFADWLLANLGDRAVPIRVGQYSGALTWADPNAMGIRTHNLYWFDGVNNHSLIADRPADQIVNLARTLVCG